MYLLNLASADLAVGVTVIGKEYFNSEGRRCSFIIGCILTTTYTSLFSIVWYMADRYCFLRHEIYYEVWVTVLLTSIIIFLTWFLSKSKKWARHLSSTRLSARSARSVR